jgi:hypothetical protein
VVCKCWQLNLGQGARLHTWALDHVVHDPARMVLPKINPDRNHFSRRVLLPPMINNFTYLLYEQSLFLSSSSNRSCRGNMAQVELAVFHSIFLPWAHYFLSRSKVSSVVPPSVSIQISSSMSGTVLKTLSACPR